MDGGSKIRDHKEVPERKSPKFEEGKA